MYNVTVPREATCPYNNYTTFSEIFKRETLARGSYLHYVNNRFCKDVDKMTNVKETVQKNAPKKQSGKPQKRREVTAVSAVRKRAEGIFGGQSSDAAKLLLLASAGLSAVFDDPKRAVSVMVLVTAEAAVGILREHSCIRASENIAKAAEPKIALRTDGEVKNIPASELREGDIFEIGEGGIFPCDSIIIEHQGLTCDESALTGSDTPAVKTACAGETLRDKLGLKYIGYSGTVVVSGTAVCKAAGHGSEAFRREPEERERPSGLVTVAEPKGYSQQCAPPCPQQSLLRG